MPWQPSGLANIKTRLTLDGLMEPTEKVVLVPLPWGQVFDRYIANLPKRSSTILKATKLGAI